MLINSKMGGEGIREVFPQNLCFHPREIWTTSLYLRLGLVQRPCTSPALGCGSSPIYRLHAQYVCLDLWFCHSSTILEASLKISGSCCWWCRQTKGYSFALCSSTCVISFLHWGWCVSKSWGWMTSWGVWLIFLPWCQSGASGFRTSHCGIDVPAGIDSGATNWSSKEDDSRTLLSLSLMYWRFSSILGILSARNYEFYNCIVLYTLFSRL